MKNLNILGIETSCDETAIAVYNSKKGLLSNELFSQIEIHKLNGGVIPDIASKYHLKKINLILDQSLKSSNLNFENIDLIAVTNRPGLPGSLMIGVSFAKSLAYAGNKKIIAVNHLEGHIFSACIGQNIEFPFLCLTASGGHTSIYLVEDFGKIKEIGNTIDDAAGEAFDKISKILELPYPGGPIIEKLAAQINFQDIFKYPRDSLKNCNFSFSGLKTAILYDLVKKNKYNLKNKVLIDTSIELKIEVSSSLLNCIKDIFINKLKLALKKYPNIKAISFVGGVSANKYLRNEIAKSFNLPVYFPINLKLCTDNAAMIAFVGNFYAQKNIFSSLDFDIL